MTTQTGKISKNANAELLRLVAMGMVTMLHALGQGGLLPDMTGSFPCAAWATWTLESLSIPAVNVFMLISGYFLIGSKFKLRRLGGIVAQVMFYSVGASIAGYLLGTGRLNVHDCHDYMKCFFPIHMNAYWFMTVYVAIYVLLPILKTGVRSLSKQEYISVIVLLLFLESLPKSILPFRIHDGKGYSFLWCLTVFLIGSFIRIHGFHVVNTAVKGWVVYILASACIFAETLALLHFNGQHDSFLQEIAGVSMEYNHIFVLTAAIGLFSAFMNAKQMSSQCGKVVCALSPMALGVYLLQENMTLRYVWQFWFRLPWALSGPLWALLVKLSFAVCGMLVMGLVVDWVRIGLFSWIMRRWQKQSQ